MTTTFSVKNFEKFQHYKDRSPPWIKLYNELLDDYAFCQLPDASKFHLIAIWLLASRSNNQIPADAAWVAMRISASSPVDLAGLKAAGFIEYNQPRSKMLAKRKQDACLEGEGETQVQTEGEGDIALPSAAPKQPRAKSRNSLPENFPAETDRAWAESHWLAKGRADLCDAMTEEIEKFRDHHRGKATMSADWPGTWRTWTRNAMNFTRKPQEARNGTGISRKPTATDQHLAGIAELARDLRSGSA